MNLEQDGFLSSEISEWIELNRQTNNSWIELVRAFNRIAQRIILTLSANDDDMQKYVGALIYIRGVTNCQSGVILAETGATLGARILARTCFEDAFYLSAVAADVDWCHRIIATDQVVRGRMARVLLSIPEHLSGLEPTHVRKLNDFLAAQTKQSSRHKTTKIEQVAKAAGLSAVYDTFYRGLSNDAAHLSVVSLNRHISEADNTFLWGPEPEQVVDTIIALCTALIYLISGIQTHFDDLEVTDFPALWAEYKRQIEIVEEWSRITR